MKCGIYILGILGAFFVFFGTGIEGRKAKGTKVSKAVKTSTKVKVVKTASTTKKLEAVKVTSIKNKTKATKPLKKKTAKEEKKQLKEGGGDGWQLASADGKSLTDILDAQAKLLDHLEKKISKTLKLKGLATKINKKTSEIRKKVTSVKAKVTSLNKKVDKGVWPEGEYCILSKGGKCPEGFSVHGGQMSSVSLYGGSPTYITPGTFGDSWIGCRYGCCTCGNYVGELRILACCK